VFESKIIDSLILKLDIIRVENTNSDFFKQAMQIYEKSFPAWEKEAFDTIKSRVESSRYIFLVAKIKSKNSIEI
jgi:hypothetical protein